jgi:hypothetical protein
MFSSTKMWSHQPSVRSFSMAIVALNTNGPHSNPTVSNKPAMYTLLGARLLELGLDVDDEGLSVGDEEGLDDEGANVMGLGLDIVVGNRLIPANSRMIVSTE